MENIETQSILIQSPVENYTDDSLFGSYCSYCGKKLTITKSSIGAYQFICDCQTAKLEQELKADVLVSQKLLKEFYEGKQELVKKTEIHLQIDIYTELIKKLQEQLKGESHNE